MSAAPGRRASTPESANKTPANPTGQEATSLPGLTRMKFVGLAVSCSFCPGPVFPWTPAALCLVLQRFCQDDPGAEASSLPSTGCGARSPARADGALPQGGVGPSTTPGSRAPRTVSSCRDLKAFAQRAFRRLVSDEGAVKEAAHLRRPPGTHPREQRGGMQPTTQQGTHSRVDFRREPRAGADGAAPLDSGLTPLPTMPRSGSCRFLVATLASALSLVIRHREEDDAG